MENWRLRISVSISLGLHLLFIFTATSLFSGAEIRRTSLYRIKVILYPSEEGKKSIAKFVSPPSVRRPIQRSEKRESLQEERQREPVLRREIDQPIPFPVQAVVRDIPVEEPKRVFPPREEEKKIEEPAPAHVGADIILDKASLLKKEEPLSISSLPGALQGNDLSDTTSGEGPEIGQGGPPGGNPGSGTGAGRGGIHLRVFGEGPGFGQGGSGGGGSGNGWGSGTDSGEGDSRGGSRKGGGIFGKLFSSSGGAGGGHARYGENPKPPYPEEARKKGMEGEVLLRVEVLANGRVGQIEVKRSCGHEMLDQSALSTVRQWKFIPASRGNGPIPCWVNIPIKFQLR